MLVQFLLFITELKMNHTILYVIFFVWHPLNKNSKSATVRMILEHATATDEKSRAATRRLTRQPFSFFQPSTPDTQVTGFKSCKVTQGPRWRDLVTGCDRSACHPNVREPKLVAVQEKVPVVHCPNS